MAVQIARTSNKQPVLDMQVVLPYRVEGNALMQRHMSLQIADWLIAWTAPSAVDSTDKGLHSLMELC